jgi:hypothetical protein
MINLWDIIGSIKINLNIISNNYKNMSKLIITNEKIVIPKGANLNNQIDKEKLKEQFFNQDYENLKLLELIEPINYLQEEVTLLYPGCGIDIFSPLIYLEKLLPNVKKANLIFVDTMSCLGIIKTIIDNVNITFSEEKNKSITFYWNKLLINLKFKESDIHDLIEQLNYDIYFERAFRIMKEQLPNYEHLVYKQLNNYGILISDSGFKSQELKKIKVPQELSAYKEMIIGTKEK